MYICSLKTYSEHSVSKILLLNLFFKNWKENLKDKKIINIINDILKPF